MTMMKRISLTAAALIVILTIFLLAELPAFAAGDVCTVTVKSSDGSVISETGYDSFETGWSMALSKADSKNDTVFTLHRNWIHDMALELPENRKITVDLNGFLLMRDRNRKQVRQGYIFHVPEGATLTIRDSDPGSTGYNGIRGGVITGGANSSGAGAIEIDAGGTCVMESGTIYRCTTSEHGGAILLSGAENNMARFTMLGGRIYFCQTVDSITNCHGGAIYADHAQISMSNANFDACYSEDNGGAIYLNDGYLTIEDSMFIGNHCRDYGGAIYINSGSLRLYRTRFSSNEADDNGGAIYIDDGYMNEIYDCIFYKNKSHNKGGAIYVNDDRTFLLDCDVIANSAESYGGGIYVDSRYDINLKGLVHIMNNSGKDGRNNLTLQDGTTSRAYLYNGGLTEGSSVGLSSTGKNTVYSKSMTAYQMEHYFFSDRGSLELKDTYLKEAPMLASVFLESSFGAIVIGVLLGAGFGAVVYLVLKKRRKEAANDEITEA